MEFNIKLNKNYFDELAYACKCAQTAVEKMYLASYNDMVINFLTNHNFINISLSTAYEPVFVSCKCSNI